MVAEQRPDHRQGPGGGRARLKVGAGLLTDTVSATTKERHPPPQAAMGFFTDTSICIGCKACEVACKQWNQLPATDPNWSGTSYDNTRQLGATTWRHVQFIEQIGRDRSSSSPRLPLFNGQIAEAKSNGTIPEVPPGTALPFFNSDRWLMHSDVCKHCANA